MKVNVVGKEKMKGVSKKTGREFDGALVHYLYKKARCDGPCSESVFVDDMLLPYGAIKVGATYDLDHDSRGYLLGFEEVK